MIYVTRIGESAERFLINSDLIEIINEGADTHITLSNGHKYVVNESMEEVLERIKDFRKEIGAAINIRRNEVE